MTQFRTDWHCRPESVRQRQGLRSQPPSRLFRFVHLPGSGQPHPSIRVQRVAPIDKVPVLEPIGSAPPKFSNKDKLNALIHKKNEVISLVCAAQGAPMPAFRSETKQIKKGVCFPEPIGGSKPKFSGDSKSQTFVRSEDSALALLCNAQGSPLPSFR